MNLREFKTEIESKDNGYRFDYGISKPFSWRGSYDEVAFDIINEPMTREEILVNINMAYNDTFIGYKGGYYTYNDYTDVHFEEDSGSYTDGNYCANLIAKIENTEPYKSQEMRLVKLIFNNGK